jgi:hypothetical protein
VAFGNKTYELNLINLNYDRLCGLVVRAPNYRSGGPEFDSRHYKKKVVGLERGSLSLVSTIDRLCDLVVRVPGYRSVGLGFDSRALQKKSSGSGTGFTQPCEYN